MKALSQVLVLIQYKAGMEALALTFLSGMMKIEANGGMVALMQPMELQKIDCVGKEFFLESLIIPMTSNYRFMQVAMQDSLMVKILFLLLEIRSPHWDLKETT